MRNYLLIYINGNRHVVTGKAATLPLSDYLRYERRLTGTKIVCAEGDCGACTVLYATLNPRYPKKNLTFSAINSCIKPLFLLDCSHIITIEGMENEGHLHPIQQAMIDTYGSQCGFCTPGIVMALAALFENKRDFTEKHVKNYLTGNLCRCTGYKGIIEAALQLRHCKFQSLSERYHSDDMMADIRRCRKEPFLIENDPITIHAPTSVRDVCKIKKKKSHIFSSATDLGVQINKLGTTPSHIISLNLIDSLYALEEKNNELHIGAKVTLDTLEKFIEKKMPTFAGFLNIFASPQIKNVGTLVGNVANASPIADLPPFLLVADACVEIENARRRRSVNMDNFYKGYKTIDLGENEIITGIRIPIPPKTDIIKLYKISKRKDLDISCVNAAFRLTLATGDMVSDIKIAYGGVAPTVRRLKKIEAFISGKRFSRETVELATKMIPDEISPISDVRGSASYRMQLSQNLLYKFYADVGVMRDPG